MSTFRALSPVQARRRALEETDLIVARGAVARRSPTSRASLPGDAPVLSLTKGLDPATGNRLSTLVTGRPVAVLSGPNMAEEIAAGLPTAAVIASEDEALAERLQQRDQLARLPHLREPRRRRRRALRGGEERDRARGGRRRRARPRRQREGGADHARARRDGAAGRGVRRPRRRRSPASPGMGDLIVTCESRHGRNRRAGELIAQRRDARRGCGRRSARPSRA